MASQTRGGQAQPGALPGEAQWKLTRHGPQLPPLTGPVLSPTEEGRAGTSPSTSRLSTGWAQGEVRSAGPLVRLWGAPGLAGQDCPGWGWGEVRLREKGLTVGLPGAPARGCLAGAGAGMGRQRGGFWATTTRAANLPIQEAPQGEVGGPPTASGPSQEASEDPERRAGFCTLSLVLPGGCPTPEWGWSLLEPPALVLRPGSSQDLAPG